MRKWEKKKKKYIFYDKLTRGFWICVFRREKIYENDKRQLALFLFLFLFFLHLPECSPRDAWNVIKSNGVKTAKTPTIGAISLNVNNSDCANAMYKKYKYVTYPTDCNQCLFAGTPGINGQVKLPGMNKLYQVTKKATIRKPRGPPVELKPVTSPIML